MSLAIIQLKKDSNHFKMRIGDKLIELPDNLTEEIINAIDSVSPFCVNHAIMVKDIWNGDHYDNDVVQVDGMQ